MGYLPTQSHWRPAYDFGKADGPFPTPTPTALIATLGVRIFRINTVDTTQTHTWLNIITKTYPYNFDPLKLHFYIVKLGFTGVCIIFLISAQKHRLWVLVRTASLMSTHNLCFEQKYEKYQSFLSENFPVLEVKFSIYLNRLVFGMAESIFLFRLKKKKKKKNTGRKPHNQNQWLLRKHNIGCWTNDQSIFISPI